MDDAIPSTQAISSSEKSQELESQKQKEEEMIPKRTPEQLGEIISLRKLISEDVSQQISSVTTTFAPSAQSLSKFFIWIF